MVKLFSEVEGIRVGIVEVKDGKVLETEEEEKKELLLEIDKILKKGIDEDKKKKIRDMLRYGKYKPSGRGKPANEYLYESAIKGNFPFINNFVDALNYVSLKHQFPISLLDLNKAKTKEFKLRRGRKGESYVFNQSGQILDLEDLLLIASFKEDEPLATPVKDSMKTKIDINSKNMVSFIYSLEIYYDELVLATENLKNFYEKFSTEVTTSFI